MLKDRNLREKQFIFFVSLIPFDYAVYTAFFLYSPEGCYGARFYDWIFVSVSVFTYCHKKNLAREEACSVSLVFCGWLHIYSGLRAGLNLCENRGKIVARKSWQNHGFRHEKAAKLLILCGFFMMGCGAGGIRTHVRTRKSCAFYMLIPAFGFRAAARPGPPTTALSPKVSLSVRGRRELFPIYPAPLNLRIRNNILGAVSRRITL